MKQNNCKMCSMLGYENVINNLNRFEMAVAVAVFCYVSLLFLFSLFKMLLYRYFSS